MALCLTIREYEFLYIGDGVRISAVKQKGRKIRIWVEAPGLKVSRENKEKPNDGSGTGDR